MKVSVTKNNDRNKPCSTFFKSNGAAGFFTIHEGIISDSNRETTQKESDTTESTKEERPQNARKQNGNEFFSGNTLSSVSTVKQHKEDSEHPEPKKEKGQVKNGFQQKKDNHDQVEGDSDRTKENEEIRAVSAKDNETQQTENSDSLISEKQSDESPTEEIKKETSSPENSKNLETSKTATPDKVTENKKSEPVEPESTLNTEQNKEQTDKEPGPNDKRLAGEENAPEEVKPVQKELGLSESDHQQNSEGQTLQAKENGNEDCVKENSHQPSPVSDSMLKILSAPNSSLKPHAIKQAQLIQASRTFSLQQIFGTGILRRLMVNAYFQGIQARLFSTIEGNIASVRGLILGQKAVISSISANAIGRVTGLIMSAIDRGMQLGGVFAGTIMSLVTNASASVFSRVNGTINQIRNFVNSFPLPSLPGVERLRSIAQNIVNRIAGTVQSALANSMAGLMSLLSRGINLIFTIINRIRVLLLNAFQTALSLILTLVSRIYSFLDSIFIRVSAMLRVMLYTNILPFINQIRLLILQRIFQLEIESVIQINEETEGNLEAIASYLGPEDSGPKEREEDNKQLVAAINLIGAKTLINHLKTIVVFRLRTLNMVTLFFSTLKNLTALVIKRVGRAVLTVFRLVISRIVRGIQRITRIIQRVLLVIVSMGSRLVSSLIQVLTKITRWIQQPVSRIIDIARNAYDRVRQSVLRLFGFN
ncbi:MAG TPA: hypothetical protein PK335_11765 [Draconibacterium sp.]|nr:hypothetical protein [Draconibacterium sp.]